MNAHIGVLKSNYDILSSATIQVVIKHATVMSNSNTVDSRYLELGYLKFCEAQSIYLNKIYIFDRFLQRNLALETFLQVQFTRSAN